MLLDVAFFVNQTDKVAICYMRKTIDSLNRKRFLEREMEGFFFSLKLHSKLARIKSHCITIVLVHLSSSLKPSFVIDLKHNRLVYSTNDAHLKGFIFCFIKFFQTLQHHRFIEQIIHTRWRHQHHSNSNAVSCRPIRIACALNYIRNIRLPRTHSQFRRIYAVWCYFELNS